MAKEEKTEEFLLHLEETKTPGIFIDRDYGSLISLEELPNGEKCLNVLNKGRKK